jgi:flagellin-like hook-associated protein FlgL
LDGITTVPNLLVDGTNTITVRVNNAGGPTGMFFDELQISGSRTTSTTTSTTSQVTTVTRIYPGLADFEPDEFTGFIEDLTASIAQVGAQQARLTMEARQIESAGINLESAVGKILDADIAKESVRFAKSSFLIESSTSMVDKASEMSQIALRLMSNR